MTNSWLTTRGLARHYQRGGHIVRALDGVDLELNRGDFLAVIGASGSGKSTLLNLLAGLDTPTGGSITLDGHDLNSLSRRDLAAHRARRVGMVFQSFQLLPHMTALENVALALTCAGTARAERRHKAAQVLTDLGLGERLDHRPLDLSGGEQQRVAVARALVKEPELLLADEPTGNLDEDSAAQIADILTAARDRDITIVMVTHDTRLAERIADRQVRLRYGRLAGDGEVGP